MHQPKTSMNQATAFRANTAASPSQETDITQTSVKPESNYIEINSPPSWEGSPSAAEEPSGFMVTGRFGQPVDMRRVYSRLSLMYSRMAYVDWDPVSFNTYVVVFDGDDDDVLAVLAVSNVDFRVHLPCDHERQQAEDKGILRPVWVEIRAESMYALAYMFDPFRRFVYFLYEAWDHTRFLDELASTGGHYAQLEAEIAAQAIIDAEELRAHAQRVRQHYLDQGFVPPRVIYEPPRATASSEKDPAPDGQSPGSAKELSGHVGILTGAVPCSTEEQQAPRNPTPRERRSWRDFLT